MEWGLESGLMPEIQTWKPSGAFYLQRFYIGHRSSCSNTITEAEIPLHPISPSYDHNIIPPVWVSSENHQLMISSQRIIRTGFKHRITSSHTWVIFQACISFNEWIFNQNTMSLRLAILDTIFSKWKSNRSRSNHLARHTSPALHIQSSPLL